MIEHNGWRLVSPLDSWEDVYEKRVQEGRDNDEYIVGMHVSSNDEVRQVGVFKVMRLKEHGESRDFIGMLKHTRVMFTLSKIC